jgi:hypothetical protein
MHRSNIVRFGGAALLAIVLAGLGRHEAAAEPERRLETALRLLNEAREELRGVHGGGDHREQALEFTVKAARQVEQAMERENHRERR